MYKIYCLVDPRDNKPFYVGATKRKLNLRLTGHIQDIRCFRPDDMSAKKILITSILKEGLRPIIRLLVETEKDYVDTYERMFYDILTKQGFNLLQSANKFNYQQQKIKDK